MDVTYGPQAWEHAQYMGVDRVVLNCGGFLLAYIWHSLVGKYVCLALLLPGAKGKDSSCAWQNFAIVPELIMVCTDTMLKTMLNM